MCPDCPSQELRGHKPALLRCDESHSDGKGNHAQLGSVCSNLLRSVSEFSVSSFLPSNLLGSFSNSESSLMVAQTVKCLSIMQETWVQPLGWEDSLEKEMATYSSTLALKISWTEELGAGYCPWGRKELARLSNFTFTLPDSAMV